MYELLVQPLSFPVASGFRAIGQQRAFDLRVLLPSGEKLSRLNETDFTPGSGHCGCDYKPVLLPPVQQGGDG